MGNGTASWLFSSCQFDDLIDNGVEMGEIRQWLYVRARGRTFYDRYSGLPVQKVRRVTWKIRFLDEKCAVFFFNQINENGEMVSRWRNAGKRLNHAAYGQTKSGGEIDP
jgi:hypothetical protein